MHIASHSQDSIIRWEAAQKLAIATILDSYNQNKLSKHFVTLRLLFKQILENNDLDPGLAAKILALPSEQQLLELLSAANVTKLHDSRQLIKLTLANDLADMFADCYHNIQLKLPYSLDSNSINTRALKNLALDYLVTTSNPKAFELATEQLKTADNLTNTFCALIALANSSYTQKEELLQDYYQRWHQHPNLLNKWFLINATIQLPGNLALVQKLLQNPAFNLKNPNNVYSVIRAFAENNLANFHAPDGSGYKFLADQVLKIDKFNSQLAAMIATPLGSGKNLDHGRQQLLQKELTRIYSEPNISSNLYEIVTKSISEKRTVYE